MKRAGFTRAKETPVPYANTNSQMTPTPAGGVTRDAFPGQVPLISQQTGASQQRGIGGAVAGRCCVALTSSEPFSPASGEPPLRETL